MFTFPICPGESFLLPTRAHLNIETSLVHISHFYPSIEYSMVDMTLISMISLSFISIREKYLLVLVSYIGPRMEGPNSHCCVSISAMKNT